MFSIAAQTKTAARLVAGPLLLLSIFSAPAFAQERTLPTNDPHANQPEATAAQVASAVEKLPAAPAAKGDANLEFCHTAEWSRACLLGLIIYRCGQYTFPLAPVGCSAAAAHFVDLLELKRIDVVLDGNSYSLPLIFSKRLERMIQEPGVQDELRSLRVLLEHYGRTRRRFDLHDWFRAMANGGHERTLEKLAVLLQDTSGVQIHIHYLQQIARDRKFPESTLRAIDDLKAVNAALIHKTLVQAQWQDWLKLYPQTKNIEADTTTLIYHFYPMAYLTHQLRGHGDRLATFIPFLFNTEYLLQGIDPESWPFRHPKPFAVDTDELRWAMRDMYGGLAGSLWGIQRVEKTPGRAKFERDFAENPYGAMRALFWSLP